MSGLLDLHLDKIPDPTTVPGGEEREVKIVSAKIAPSKSTEGRDVVKVVVTIVDEPTAKSIFENMAIPMKGDSEQAVYMMSLRLKQFFKAIDVDPADPGEPGSWKGLTGWAFVGLGTNDLSGEEENKVGRWIEKK
jgi:hypothetical protein